jgi:uncharacterized membrane protein YhfC
MSGMYYKGLGFLVWKGVTWYLRRRYGSAPKKIGAGALVAAVIAAAIAIAQRQRSTPA